MVFACLGEFCDSVELTVVMVDAVVTTPATSLSFRVWTPRMVEAVAMWKGEPVSVPLRWSSADGKVVTVSDTGRLTPGAAGSTTVQVEASGVVTTLGVTVHPEPPADCTLKTYAEQLGSVGPKAEDIQCDPEDPDMCSGTSKQELVGGGSLEVSGGLDHSVVSLRLPGVELAEAWALAGRCLELPPEVAALDVPSLIQTKRPVTKNVQLSGPQDGDGMAMIEVKPRQVHIQLPSGGCTFSRSFAVDKVGVVTMEAFVGC
jgi:hypothetical protein